MKKFVVLCVLIILVSSASAFDGQRKGFVLGGGLGFGPVANTTYDDFLGNVQKIEKSGLALNFLVGYAWDEQNMLVFLRDGVIFSRSGYFEDINVVQGFTGLGYYHYFGVVGKSAYICGGLGLQDYSVLDSDYSSPEPNAGILIGGGYEFARHIQFHSSLSFGKTEGDVNHVQLTVQVAAVAF